jgi:hypothetical protein
VRAASRYPRSFDEKLQREQISRFKLKEHTL